MNKFDLENTRSAMFVMPEPQLWLREWKVCSIGWISSLCLKSYYQVSLTAWTWESSGMIHYDVFRTLRKRFNVLGKEIPKERKRITKEVSFYLNLPLKVQGTPYGDLILDDNRKGRIYQKGLKAKLKASEERCKDLEARTSPLMSITRRSKRSTNSNSMEKQRGK